MIRTYETLALERRLMRCSQELKSLKTIQNYGMSQTTSFVGNTISLTGRAKQTLPGYDFWTRYIYVVLKFSGDYADNVAIGALESDRMGQARTYWSIVGGDQPNELLIYYRTWDSLNYQPTEALTDRVTLTTNMPGILSLVSQEE